MKSITCQCGNSILVDDEDYERLVQFTWNCASRSVQRITHVTHSGGRVSVSISIANEVIVVPSGMQPDHIDRDIHDNRKCNLRIATIEQNCANKGIRSDNKSGYKGVSWLQREMKWQVGIKYNGKRKFIGYFDDKDEAARAYNRAAKELLGEFAFLNNVPPAT